MIACGTKRGKVLIYQLSSGRLIAECENAHYLAISDLDISTASGAVGTATGSSEGDLIITGGKDSKVKVWMLTNLLANNGQCWVEFNDHSSEVTAVQFSFGASQSRAFSCSLDKTFKVYDLPGKCIIKTIQVQSQILRMAVDYLEQSVYLACDNLNVYQYPLSSPSSESTTKHKKTLTHKKRVTAMTLSVDGRNLITGDA